MSDVQDSPGLIIVQIDGMSHPVLEHLVSVGRMPALGALISSGSLTLDRWLSLLPPCTPASQAGILHGHNAGIPGFRWFEKPTGRLLVANHAKDAAEIERRLSTGTGILAHAGVSVGNLLAGDAAFSHLTMATIEAGGQPGSSRDRGAYPIDPLTYLRVTIEMIGELLDEIAQARKQRVNNVHPRMRRGWRYANGRTSAMRLARRCSSTGGRPPAPTL